jgi:hypothetical protein
LELQGALYCWEGSSVNANINTENTRSRAKRGPTRLIWGLALGLVGLLVAGVGAFGLSLAGGNDGYVGLGDAAFHGNGYAVATDGYDWSRANLAGAGYDTVRVQVTSTHPVFVGIAPADAVQHYLADVAYSTATSGGNKQVAYTDHQGSAPATLPADAGMWLASATGSGTQAFEFKAHATGGNLALVAMNADGSQAVSGTVRTAATVPGLAGIAWGVLAVGVLVCAGGVLLIVRRRRT